MFDDDELIARSQAIRAQAQVLVAWSQAVCETSRAIVNRGISEPFAFADEPAEDRGRFAPE